MVSCCWRSLACLACSKLYCRKCRHLHRAQDMWSFRTKSGHLREDSMAPFMPPAIRFDAAETRVGYGRHLEVTDAQGCPSHLPGSSSPCPGCGGHQQTWGPGPQPSGMVVIAFIVGLHLPSEVGGGCFEGAPPMISRLQDAPLIPFSSPTALQEEDKVDAS